MGEQNMDHHLWITLEYKVRFCNQITSCNCSQQWIEKSVPISSCTTGFFSTRRKNLYFEEGFAVKSMEKIYFSQVRNMVLISVSHFRSDSFPFSPQCFILWNTLYYEILRLSVHKIFEVMLSIIISLLEPQGIK